MVCKDHTVSERSTKRSFPRCVFAVSWAKAVATLGSLIRRSVNSDHPLGVKDQFVPTVAIADAFEIKP